VIDSFGWKDYERDSIGNGKDGLNGRRIESGKDNCSEEFGKIFIGGEFWKSWRNSGLDA
jgi:hypothetical protein